MSLDGGITHLASWGGNTIMPTLSGLFFAGAVYRYSKGGAYGQFLYGGFGALMCSGNFRAKAGQPLTVVSAESSARDVAPGETVTGVVSVKNAQTNPPQLFQLQFGTDTTRPVTADAVL